MILPQYQPINGNTVLHTKIPDSHPYSRSLTPTIFHIYGNIENIYEFSTKHQ